MMTPIDRQTFLQKLHQKQQQEQAARGKPRLGKPPGAQVRNCGWISNYMDGYMVDVFSDSSFKKGWSWGENPTFTQK